jgi:hypothetical protein
MPKKDKAATEAANFMDPDSFIFKDGREWLAGDDWIARKWELWRRCAGRCEETFTSRVSNKVLRCFNEGVHPHHIIKKSISHDDRLLNLKCLCERHHRMEHPEKQPRWTKREASEALEGLA